MGVAAVAAILLALIVRGMIAGHSGHDAKASIQAPAAPVQPMARVLVATRNIKAGTRIGDDDLGWQDWPLNSVNPAYIVDGAGAPARAGAEGAPVPVSKPQNGVVQAVADKVAPSASKEAYVGGVAREDILANEPIIDAKIVRADEGGFMAVMLRPGMRALAVPVSVDNTAGGFILPGDHVDILATHQTQKGGAAGGTVDSVQPVLRNVRVLAIDQQVQTDKDKQSVIGATATLEVSPEQGQAVTLAKASGTLTMMLRSYADVSGPSSVADAHAVGAGDGTVRVFRNGQVTDVAVSQ